MSVREGAKDLTAVFDEVQGMMAEYVPPFKAGGGQIRAKRDYHLVVPKPVVISANAYGGKPYSAAMASLILQKDFVGFYYMPVYMEPGVKKKLAPELVKLLKGKSCFHVKEFDGGCARVDPEGAGDRDGMFSGERVGVREAVDSLGKNQFKRFTTEGAEIGTQRAQRKIDKREKESTQQDKTRVGHPKMVWLG